MAKNHLQPFANGTGANITSEEDWGGAQLKTTLERGFQSGIAKSDRVNRAIAQGTSAGYAIGQLVADYADQDAGVDAVKLYAGFQDALEKFFRAKMFDVIYPVGSVYCATVSTNPRELFGVGVWERIGEGRTLIDAGNDHPAGTTGGAESHTLTANEMPAHSHQGSTSSAGGHNHTRGSMNITGAFAAARHGGTNVWRFDGAFYEAGRFNATVRHGGDDDWGSFYGFDASRAWTGATSWNGDHTHTVTVSSTGGGQAFSVRNPYLAVFIWKRVE